MIVWRIATESKRYASTDLSGKGAELSPGRWNALGLPILYAANTPSLAMLETIAHIHDFNLPQLKYLISIEIEDSDWKARETLEIDDLPAGWNAIPHENKTVLIGSEWLQQCKSLVLCVPSAITPEETVVLVNPQHPRSKALKARKLRQVDYKTVIR